MWGLTRGLTCLSPARRGQALTGKALKATHTARAWLTCLLPSLPSSLLSLSFLLSLDQSNRHVSVTQIVAEWTAVEGLHPGRCRGLMAHPMSPSGLRHENSPASARASQDLVAPALRGCVGTRRAGAVTSRRGPPGRRSRSHSLRDSFPPAVSRVVASSGRGGGGGPHGRWQNTALPASLDPEADQIKWSLARASDSCGPGRGLKQGPTETASCLGWDALGESPLPVPVPRLSPVHAR